MTTYMRATTNVANEMELGALISSLPLFGGKLEPGKNIEFGEGVWKVTVRIPEEHFVAFKAHRIRVTDTFGVLGAVFA